MALTAPIVTDPTLALRWLFRARRGSLAIQIVLMLVAEAGTDLHVHSPGLIAVLATMIAIDVGETLWTRRTTPPAWLVPAHGVVDLIGLTAILALSGGPRNPLVAAYLVYLALLAVVLPMRGAWAVCGAAILCHAIVVVHPGHLPGLEAEALPAGHRAGHIVAFDLSAIAITWVVNQLSNALRRREAEEREAQNKRATTERLAALGTLAAGITHELGTPLGTIQLLAEEARNQPDPAGMASLLEQVERCRSILDRLRVGAPAQGDECTADVGSWVEEWRRAAPEVDVEVQAPAAGVRVAGAEANWRGAVWVALDNARRAGARRVIVVALAEGDALEVRIGDDGRGIDLEAASHVGEPFRTGWGGTGLGLFVARSFARSVGGDVALAPGPQGGALATIRMLQVPA